MSYCHINEKKARKIILFTMLSFFLMFSINISATSVSNNDGSALITKTEFDTLESSFQNKINEYNVNIDSKIDEAIALYLKGVKINSEPVNYYKNYVNLTANNPIFLNEVQDVGGKNQKCELLINILRKQTIKKFNNLHFEKNLYRNSGTWQCVVDCALYFGDEPNWNLANNNWTNVWYDWHYDRTMKNATGTQRMAGIPLQIWAFWNPATPTTSGNYNYQASSQVREDGSGSAWIYQKFGNVDCLKYFADNVYVSYIADITAHRYKDCATLNGSYYIEDNGKADTTEITANIPSITDFGTFIIGDASPTIDDEENYTTGTLRINRRQTHDDINYLNYIFAINTDTNLAVLSENAKAVADTTSTPIDPVETVFYDVYYEASGGKKQTNKMSGITSSYYPMKFVYEGRKINSFAIQALTSLLGEPVYHGQGMPLLKCDKEKDKLKVEITIDSSNTSILSKINWKLSDMPLNNDEFDTRAKIKYSGTNEERGATITKELTNIDAKTVLWFNCYNVIQGADATITQVKIDDK